MTVQNHAFLWDASARPTPSKTGFQAIEQALHPGALGMVLVGSAQVGRTGIAARLAGFEMRDALMLAGTGYLALLLQKQLDGTYARNALAHGCGALAIDASRVGWPGGKAPEIGTPGWGGPAKKLTAVPGQEGSTVERAVPSPQGRFPANLLFSTEAAAELDARAGVRKSGKGSKASGGALMRANRPGSPNGIYGELAPTTCVLYGDEGGASRFFHSFAGQHEMLVHLARLLSLPVADAQLLVPDACPAVQVAATEAGWSRFAALEGGAQ